MNPETQALQSLLAAVPYDVITYRDAFTGAWVNLVTEREGE